MATSNHWDALCEAYLAADELVAEVMVRLASMTAEGGAQTPTVAEWALLRDVRAVRDEAEAAMVAYLRSRKDSGVL